MRPTSTQRGVTTLEYLVLGAVLVLGLVVGVSAFKGRVGESLQSEGNAAVEVARGQIGPVARRYGESGGPNPAGAQAAQQGAGLTAEPEQAVLARPPAPAPRLAAPAPAGGDPEPPAGFTFWDGVSIGVGFVPIAGSGQSVVELFSGRDYITGQPANRWLAAVGIVAGLVPGGKAAVKGTTTAVRVTAKATDAAATTVKATTRVADATAAAGRGIVRHGPTNPGPLPANIAATFRGGSYTARVLDEPVELYRVYGGKAGELGSYWTRVKPSGPLQSRMDLALDPSWGNTAEKVTTIRVPKGTTIFEGAAERQGNLLGGGNQVFIPKVDPAWVVK
ncbi:pre-toxin TG domain-containing protein [Myxococcota bacterium]|nr:pre-toxin TG domain-containing protein [Myxococcota bacterium]